MGDLLQSLSELALDSLDAESRKNQSLLRRYTTLFRPLSLPSKLRIPLEILERILSLAFPSSSSLPNSSIDSPPPRPPVHLLLVSRAIHGLCLPLLYRSLYLNRAELWEIWFGREGLFVGDGEDAKRRRGWVEEVWILEDQTALFPLASPESGLSRVVERGGFGRMQPEDWMGSTFPALFDEDEDNQTSSSSSLFPNLLDVFYNFPSLSAIANTPYPHYTNLVNTLRGLSNLWTGYGYLEERRLRGQILRARSDALRRTFLARPSSLVETASSAAAVNQRIHLPLLSALPTLLQQQQQPASTLSLLLLSQPSNSNQTPTLVLHHHHDSSFPSLSSVFHTLVQLSILSPETPPSTDKIVLDFSDEQGEGNAREWRRTVLRNFGRDDERVRREEEVKGWKGRERDWCWLVEGGEARREVGFWEG